ncbi:hypothetical protein [Tenacibaculum amylolyticum]|uniref:hypothetical protein n=1 Tax=Tenacibaculum amylolyticum TaxID=104269 RepID=UPI0038949E78
MKMTKLETEMMLYFLYRVPMYIKNVDKDNIISFMHGADFGKRTEPHWTTLLNEFISLKYKIEGNALGWSYQVELFSKQEQIEWIDGFKKLMITLIKESDQIPYTKKMQKLINMIKN